VLFRSRGLLNKVKEYKADLQSLKEQLRQSAAGLSDSDAARAELGLGDSYYSTSAGQRERMLAATERMQKTSDRLQVGKQQLAETEVRVTCSWAKCIGDLLLCPLFKFKNRQIQKRPASALLGGISIRHMLLTSCHCSSWRLVHQAIRHSKPSGFPGQGWQQPCSTHCIRLANTCRVMSCHWSCSASVCGQRSLYLDLPQVGRVWLWCCFLDQHLWQR